MLLKKQNDKRAEKLRTILLLEADFNHLNKKLGRDLMAQAEKYQLIAPEQFGSRKRHSSIDQVLVKRLYYDALRLSRTNGFLCSNDAKACYDRILHSVASIAMQRIGMPLGPIKCMLQALQGMKHYIKTSHGISTSSYGATLEDGKPVQGSGQGNGASPTIWALISTPLLNMVRSLGHGVALTTPLSKEAIKFVGCSFVDDTDLLQTSPDGNQSLDACQHQMQSFIDAWSGGLRATGGALVPSKSWLYPIEFIFNAQGIPSYRDPSDMNLNFAVKDEDNIRQHLSQIHPSISKETLGVHLAPDGNDRGQIEYLKSKIAKWVDKVRTNHISKLHAFTAMSTTIHKSLEYSAPTTNITEPEWNKLMAPLNKCSLQTNGLCSKISKTIREGPIQRMGLQFKCMYKTQEIMKLEKYLTFRMSSGIVGKMIRLSEELIKLETGLPGNIFALDYKKYQILATPSWIKSIWKSVHMFNIKLEMQTPPLAETKENDLFLMQEFVAQGFPKRKLQLLNACRKFLQINTLGDITNGNGTHINRMIKMGCKHECSKSKLVWPTQSKPDNDTWKIWRSALRKTFEVNRQVAIGQIRRKWAANPSREFLWYHDHISNCLLKSSPNNKWKMFRSSTQRGRRALNPVFHYIGTELSSLPNHARPASIITCSVNRVKFTGSGDSASISPTTNYSTLEEYVDSLPPLHRWPFSHITGAQNLNHITQAIESGNCALVSDGSYEKDNQQVAAAGC